MDEQVRDWSRILLSNEPADRKAAEEGVRKCYRALGLAMPKVVWCGSPLMARLVQGVLVHQGRLDPSTIRHEIWKLLENARLKRLAGGIDIQTEPWRSLGMRLRSVVAEIIIEALRELNNINEQFFINAWRFADDIEFGPPTPMRFDSLSETKRLAAKAEMIKTIEDEIRGASFFGSSHGFWLLNGYPFNQEPANFLALVIALAPDFGDIEGLVEISRSAGWMLPHKQI